MARTGTKEKKSMAWGWIIFWFIVLWPLGVLFLFRKLSKDKSAVIKDSGKVTVMSFVLAGIGVLVFMNTVGRQGFGAYYYLWAVSLVGGGVWTFFIARKMKADSERYKKYLAIVVNQGQSLIDNIAAAVGFPYETVSNDLQKMIDTGYFAGAYIDISQKEIILPKTTVSNEPVSPISPNAQAPLIQIQERIVSCKGCGANNRVMGQLGECEYCASYLQ